MQSLSQPLKILILAIILSIGVSYVYADWTGPTLTAPGGNVSSPINVSAMSQVKSGGLWVASLGTDGGATFGGSVKIGTSNAVCTSAISGMLRYNSTIVQYCDGSMWCELGTSCAKADCNLPWGGSISSGSSVTAYQSASSPNCSSLSESRTCANGTLSGTYTNPSCAACTASNQSTNMCSGYYFQICDDQSFSYSTECTGYNQSMSQYCASKTGAIARTGSCGFRRSIWRCTCN